MKKNSPYLSLMHELLWKLSFKKKKRVLVEGPGSNKVGIISWFIGRIIRSRPRWYVHGCQRITAFHQQKNVTTFNLSLVMVSEKRNTRIISWNYFDFKTNIGLIAYDLLDYCINGCRNNGREKRRSSNQIKSFYVSSMYCARR